MVGNVSKFSQPVKFFRIDTRVLENAGPAIEVFPVMVENPMLYFLVKLRARIRGRYGKLDRKGIELLGISNGIEYALDRVVGQAERIIRNYANA